VTTHHHDIEAIKHVVRPVGVDILVASHVDTEHRTDGLDGAYRVNDPVDDHDHTGDYWLQLTEVNHG
jgi:hypothetical protein